MVVERIPIIKLVIIFFAYLLSHWFVGKKLDDIKLENDIRPGNPETFKSLKTLTFMFKWWPAGCVVATIIYLIFG